MNSSSTPVLEEFDPTIIPFQYKVVKLIRSDFDFKKGALEILLSGSVGSAKSLLLAHLIATHAIMNPGSGILVGRRTLKDMKNTIWATLLRHFPLLMDYWNKADMTIRLPNKSIIYGVSWDDGNYNKFRSYELSMAVIEELTENKDKEIYDEIRMRVGRCPHVKENLLICATNPDSPSHWAYKYFVANETDSRKVFYSKTSDNPFLPAWYIEQLRDTLDEKQAMRMLEGKWIEIAQDVVYYSFDSSVNFINEDYYFNKYVPIDIMHDFNIGRNKPMSLAVGQVINSVFHVAKTILLEGASTQNILDELADSGVLDLECPLFRVFGDASGSHKDTRNNRSDYEIIKDFLSRYKTKNGRAINFEMQIARSNPPIRERHNLINGLFKSASGKTRMFIYKQAKDSVEGFRLTQYKKGANLVEDDSLREQHVTTAIGYWAHKVENHKPNTPIQIF